MSVEREIEALIPSLRRYARALCRRPDLADDLVQDTLERALSRLSLWRRGSDLRAWLFTILHNIHANGARRRAVNDAALDIVDWRNRLGQVPAQTAREEIFDLVRALDRLPEEQRQVLLLVGLEGFAYAEAARVLGVPIGTVMSRLSRGREALRHQLGDDSTPLLRQVK